VVPAAQRSHRSSAARQASNRPFSSSSRATATSAQPAALARARTTFTGLKKGGKQEIRKKQKQAMVSKSAKKKQ